MLPLIECAFKEDGEIQKIINDQKTRHEKKKTSQKSHRNIKSQKLKNRYLFLCFEKCMVFHKIFHFKISFKCDYVFN